MIGVYQLYLKRIKEIDVKTGKNCQAISPIVWIISSFRSERRLKGSFNMRKDFMRRVKMNGVLMVNLQVKKFWLTLILCCKFVGFPQVRQLWNLRRLSIGEVITICPKLQAIRYIRKNNSRIGERLKVLKLFSLSGSHGLTATFNVAKCNCFPWNIKKLVEKIGSKIRQAD